MVTRKILSTLFLLVEISIIYQISKDRLADHVSISSSTGKTQVEIEGETVCYRNVIFKITASSSMLHNNDFSYQLLQYRLYGSSSYCPINFFPIKTSLCSYPSILLPQIRYIDTFNLTSSNT